MGHFPKQIPLQHKGQDVVKVARASEWWGYKFSPLLATIYASVAMLDASVFVILPRLLLLLLSLTVGAVYVSVLNDWTDREDDRIAGKNNRLAGKSALFVGTLLTFCILAGLCFGIYFRSLDSTTGLLYLGSWVAYSLYSLPPFRLKVRGVPGVLADAFGAHVFPQLLCVSLVSNWLEAPLPAPWWMAVGIWALACGVRNILWHQLGDASADRASRIRTLVTIKGERFSQLLGVRVCFPAEVVAFVTMLVLIGEVAPFIFAGIYTCLEIFRARFWGIRPVILAPNQRILLNEYYSVFFPLAVLVIQSFRYPRDLIVLVLHLLLFNQHIMGTMNELRAAAVTILKKLLR